MNIRHWMVLAVVLTSLGCAPTHVRVSDSHTMDDARARLILKTVPGFDVSQVWFATGAEYWDSGTCLSGRDIAAFTKPALSSPGIWRGRKTYVRQPAPGVDAKCIDPDAFDYRGFNLDTASFIDPDSMDLDEAWDGVVPGVFQVYDGVSDDELRNISGVIDETRACLKGDSKCSYPINRDTKMHWSDRELAWTLTTANLVSVSIDHDYETGKPCYSLVFTELSAFGGAWGMDICYRNEAVSKVDVGGMVIE